MSRKVKRLKRPNLDFSDLFDVCLKSLRSSTNKSLIISNKQVFVDSYNDYILLAEKLQLSNFQDNSFLITNGNEEIKTFIVDLYDKLRDNKLPSEIHNQIKLGSDRCAYCGYGEVLPLDHYLQKSKYPLTSINPLNLIPCCSDCNFKLNDLSHTNHPAIIHPYFEHDDDIYLKDWIFASIPDNQPFFQIPNYQNVAIEFFTDFKNSTLNTSLRNRMDFQFKTLMLNKYKSQSSQLISGEVKILINMKKKGVPQRGLISYCKERMNHFPVNSYFRAVYFAFANSQKFINHIVSNY